MKLSILSLLGLAFVLSSLRNDSAVAQTEFDLAEVRLRNAVTDCVESRGVNLSEEEVADCVKGIWKRSTFSKQFERARGRSRRTVALLPTYEQLTLTCSLRIRALLKWLYELAEDA